METHFTKEEMPAFETCITDTFFRSYASVTNVTSDEVLNRSPNRGHQSFKVRLPSTLTWLCVDGNQQWRQCELQTQRPFKVEGTLVRAPARFSSI